MNKKFVSSLLDVEPTFFESAKYRLLNLFINGYRVLLLIIAFLIFIEFVKFREDLKLIAYNFKYSSALTLVGKISLETASKLIVFLLFLVLILLPIIIIVQRRYRWEYSDAGVIEISKSNHKIYSYGAMSRIEIDGKFRLFVIFETQSGFSKFESTNWYSSDKEKFYEFIEFLILKKNEIKNSIYIRPFKGQKYSHVHYENMKETLEEYFVLHRI